MQYISHYESPLGRILLAADEEGQLPACGFEGQKYFARSLRNEQEEKEIPLFERAKRWLDLYFSGTEPGSFRAFAFSWHRFPEKGLGDPLRHPLRAYYDLRGDRRASGGGKRIVPHVGRAVGGAVGRNPISILVPCHRVVGASGQSHRLCRGPGSKSKIIDTGENGYAGTFYPQEGNRFMKTEERTL